MDAAPPPPSRPPAAELPPRSTTGRVLLAIAYVILLVACLRNIGDEWEGGARGGNGARYSHIAVQHTVHYGLGATLGTPAFITEVDGKLEREVNWHHPPVYWLYLAAWCWPLGVTPPVMRIATVVLLLPSVLWLFQLLRRRCGELHAGVGSLLYAACPHVAYYGPMVLQDGPALSAGIATALCFQRYLDAPGRGRFWATAAAFFVACSIDFTGYWWGPALLVLGLAHERRRLAIRAIVGLFFVAVVAGAAWVIHCGLAMDGVAALVELMYATFHLEQHYSKTVVTPERLARAMDDLWLVHGNLVAASIGGLGLLAMPFVREKSLRQMAVVGVALLVPGLLNCGVMWQHTIDHIYWPLQGFAGVSVLAAILPSLGLGLVQGYGWRRAAGAGLVALGAFTTVWGIAKTHYVISKHELAIRNDTAETITKAMPHLEGCSWTLTSAPSIAQPMFGHTTVWYDIDTPAKLQTVLDYARYHKMRATVGVVVHPNHRDSDLPTLLDTMAPRIEVDGILVYRVRL
ncbi:MAG: glycosyltransferase family 39 protein [Planctomycetes bacterium]|nr:glycosyltransferase family 39 protein [Planctomycetota bacterium]